MPNNNPSGRNAPDDQQRSSFRSQDPSMREDRDDERSMFDRDRDRDRSRRDQDEGYRTSERYGQGQSGYTAGRYAEDRSLGFENRNMGYGGRYSEDRQQPGMGVDDRYSGRGGQGYYQDRSDRYNQGFYQGFQPGGFNQQTSFNPVGAQGSYGDSQRGIEGREGYGMGMGRGSFSGRGGQAGFGSQSFPVQGGGYGGYGQHVGGGVVGGYGQHGTMQSGFGQTQDVRGPHRGKGPVGWQRSDERIREMVCETLTDDDNIDATQIEVRVISGEVILTGMVPDRYTKRMTEDVVERVPGVKDVQNQLKIGSQSQARGVGKPDSEPGKHRA